MVGVKSSGIFRSTWAWMGRRSAWAAGAMALLVASPGASQLGDPNAPLQFDYQERTGFPLAFEERLVTLEEANGIVGTGLMEASPTAVEDWETVYNRLVTTAPPGRANVRVVRVFTDQPIFVKGGVALIPDPSDPESPLSPDDFHVNQACDPNRREPDREALHRASS